MSDAGDEALLRWYAPRASLYPWRRRPTPYRVLVSEVMLQQTQAARVAPAFRRFLGRFPSVRALAAAPRSEVVRAWAGLGYNRRAVALSEAARAIVRDHGGRVPRDLDALCGLPGVGPYTASAVAAIAFGAPVVAVDTNVRRVVGRVRLGVDTPDAEEVQREAAAWLGATDPATWNQAVMDLGREVCRPAPRCGECPVAPGCSFRRRLPVRARAAARRSQPFEGSSRQLRGRIVDELRGRPSMSLASLASRLAEPPDRVTAAVHSLARDGVVATSGGAVRGRVALHD